MFTNGKRKDLPIFDKILFIRLKSFPNCSSYDLTATVNKDKKFFSPDVNKQEKVRNRQEAKRCEGGDRRRVTRVSDFRTEVNFVDPRDNVRGVNRTLN